MSTELADTPPVKTFSPPPQYGDEPCCLPFVFKLLIPFLFGGTQTAGGQLKLFSLKHTAVPQTPDACTLITALLWAP